MTACGARRSQRDALRQLVTRLNSATERREGSRRGTREFQEATESERRYQRILLDDELFERFIEGDASLDPQGNGRTRPRSNGRDASPQQRPDGVPALGTWLRPGGRPSRRD